MSLRPRPGRPSWLTVGLIAVSLGIVALVVSLPLTMLRDAGWPWLTTMSEQVNPPSATATIAEDDGTVHQFTGAPADTRAWLSHKEHELKTAHGIYPKIAVGRALTGVGWALLVLGGALLLWRALAAGLGRTRKHPSSRIFTGSSTT